MTVDEDAPAARGQVPAESAAVTSRRARLRAAIQRRVTADHLLAAVLGLLVLTVHDVGYLLSQSYWTDEAWVAVSTRFPLSQLPALTSSTPIGWSVLVRLLTPAGDQAARLLPLGFAGAAAVTAYWLARQLDWRWRPASVGAGLLAGLAVLLDQPILAHNDLKQYTADACVGLLALALTSRLERQWSRRGLAALSVASWGGMLFSHTVAFIGAAAFGAVCIVELARRAWRRLTEAVIAGAATAVLMAGVYEGFDARAISSGLTFSPHFRHYYLPLGRGLPAAISFVTSHVAAAQASFDLGPAWLGIPLFVVGLVTICRLGRPATAITLAALWPEMLAVSALHRYPFLDRRTSTFLFAITVVVAAVGVAGLCSLLRPWLKGAVAAGLAAAAVTAFAISGWPSVRSHTIPVEDVRDQARYVAAHAAPTDVIVVNMSSNWGFAYYWPAGRPARRDDDAVVQDYEAYFPGQPRIIVARSRGPLDVDAALSQALARARAQRAQAQRAQAQRAQAQRAQAQVKSLSGGRAAACVRIWLVRTHMSVPESAAWQAALSQQGLSSQPVGDAGLSVVSAGGSPCR